MPIRLGILETHPIQYKAPLFRALAKEPGLDIMVHYCMIPDAHQQGTEFGVDFEWDIPLLDGYPQRVLRNVAREPSVLRFGGCDTPEIAAIIRSSSFDVWLVNGWVAKSCLQALLACRRYGVPCLVRGESNALRPRVAWKRYLHRLLLRQYAAALYIGALNRDFYNSLGVASNRLFFAPYCVDNTALAAAAARARPRRDAIRESWNLLPSNRVFLFCGKLSAKKRPLDLIHAAARVGLGSVNLRLLFVGDGELRAECEALAASMGVHAVFAGFLNQSRIVDAYVASDCLVLPSDSGETWGLVVNEAMACGVPALVSNQAGCHPDLVLPGDTGSVFPCGNRVALSALLQSHLDDPSIDQRQGARAAQHIAHYSIETCVRGVLQAVTSVTTGTAEAHNAQGRA